MRKKGNKIMIVKELIEELQKYDGNTKVNVYGFAEFDCGYIEGWFGGKCERIEHDAENGTISLYSEKKYDWDDEDEDPFDERKGCARDYCAEYGWDDEHIEIYSEAFSYNPEEKAEIAAYLHEVKPL